MSLHIKKLLKKPKHTCYNPKTQAIDTKNNSLIHLFMLSCILPSPTSSCRHKIHLKSSSTFRFKNNVSIIKETHNLNFHLVIKQVVHQCNNSRNITHHLQHVYVGCGNVVGHNFFSKPACLDK